MKFIKYFVLVTAIISVIGLFALMTEGTADIYSYWTVSAIVLASYYIFKK